MAKVKYLKLQMSLDSARKEVRTQRPKFIGKEVRRIPCADIDAVFFTIGRMATLGPGILMKNGESFWMPSPGKHLEKRARALVEEIATSAGLQRMSQDGFVMYFGRPGFTSAVAVTLD